MNSLLKDIAAIQMGYSFRSRLDFMGKGPTAVVQMKDLGDDHRVDCSNLMRVDLGSIKEHHLLKPGDIVFRSRGQVTTAALYIEDPGPAVVAAPLIKIRVDSKVLLPDYLVWFINQSPAQAFLASRAKGTAQRMIGKQTLSNLEVSVPSIGRQRAIVEVAALADEEQRLLIQIAKHRLDLVSQKLMHSTKEV